MKNLLKAFAILLLLLITVAAVGYFLMRNTRPISQPVLLADGTRLQLMDITVGTNHVYGTPLERALRRLPDPLEETILRMANQQSAPNTLQTAETNIVVWLEQTGLAGAPMSSTRTMLRAVGERFGGAQAYNHFWLPAGQSNRVHTVRFASWPRRPEMLELVVLEQGNGYQHVPIGSFSFNNPLRSEAPSWQPDPAGTLRQAGDLEVTLLDFVSGVGNSMGQRWNKETGKNDQFYSAAQTNEEPHAVVRVRFDSPRGTNETWKMFDAHLSDATGNAADASSRSGMTDVMRFSPILWPGEDAWKLRLHLKRSEGFLPGELITFSNIAIPPLNTTNTVNLTNELDGIQMVFEHLIHRPPRPESGSWSSSDLSEARLVHDELGETNQIDLVRIIAQPMGTNLTSSGSSWSGSYHEFRPDHIPTNATHLDFTFSVQKARFVEFDVAPNWITHEYVIGGEK